ncbi:MAG: thymidylate synthase [Candidatus Lokiarchaeota archaeon]|nr:thymidylate synthase [Candidatus Lokiarchaeota archaeon]
MRIYVIYQDEFGERIIGNLLNMKDYCEVCELRCERETCRGNYPSFASNILGMDEIEKSLPTFIEEPLDYLPVIPGGIDVLIVVGLHPDLCSAMPEFAEKNNIGALLFPVEDGMWIKLGLQNSIRSECEKRNIEVAFPRPACALDYTGKPIIDKFIDYFQIGKPEVKLHIEKNIVNSYKVIRSAPCGSTWYVCRQILGKNIQEISEHGAEIISQAHHSFPCSASMVVDPALGDTNLHIAGYLIRDTIFDEIRRHIPDFEPKVLTHEQIAEM